MPRSRSSSSNDRSSSSADRTSNTSHTSPDLNYKGKEREVWPLEVGLDEEEEQGQHGTHSRTYDQARNRRTSWAGKLIFPTPTNRKKRVIHPYPLSGGSGRRRRLSSLTSRLGGRRRMIQLILALSIPILGLLLANEIRIGNDRMMLYANVTPASRTHDWEGLDMHTPPCEITELRRGYEKKRRRELLGAQERPGSFSYLTGMGMGMGWTTTEAQAQGDFGDWWPSWWGGRDEVGKSPYDYTAPPLISGEKKRVLFLTSEYMSFVQSGN
jgi:hypothetical protein